MTNTTLNEETPPSSSNIYIHSLPAEIKDDELIQIFGKFGDIDSARVMVDFNTKESKGYGFVKYKNAESAQTAIQTMHGFQIGAKTLVVKPANENGEAPGNTPGNNVYVKNLPGTVNLEQLKESFAQYGAVLECRILCDFNTGLSRGQALVRFETDEGAAAAISNMNNVPYPVPGNIKPLSVRFADTEEEKAERKNKLRKRTTVGSRFVPYPNSSPGYPDSGYPGQYYQGYPSFDGYPSYPYPPYPYPSQGGYGYPNNPYNQNYNNPYQNNMNMNMNMNNMTSMNMNSNPYQNNMSNNHYQNNHDSSQQQQQQQQQQQYSSPHMNGQQQFPPRSPQQPQSPHTSQYSNQHQNFNSSSSYAPGQDPNVYVYHLPPETKDTDIYQRFGKYGNIQSIKIARDPAGVCKGYGFIRFNNMESAMGAINAENGAQMGAKVLSVSLAKQKGQNQY